MTSNDETAATPDFDFGHLDISEATARFELPWVAPGAYLIVRPANEVNRPYREGVLSLSGKRHKAAASATGIDPESANQDREDDRKLYPRHVVVNGGGIQNKARQPVSMLVLDNKVAFIKALPNWIFDKLRSFCLRPENFVRSPDELPPDAGTVAGN